MRFNSWPTNRTRTRRWVIGEVSVSLLLAWLIARVFLGRHVVRRLRRVSHALRYGVGNAGQAGLPVQGGDEIADMARAVEQFLEDRRRRRFAEDALHELNVELEARVTQRTAELSAALAGQRAEIVERQLAEETARASEDFLDNIVENIPDMIFGSRTRPPCASFASTRRASNCWAIRARTSSTRTCTICSRRTRPTSSR